MAKEKKAVLEQEKKDLTFYYEIIGIITILVSTIALARLGQIGYYLMISFRIIFGDWYFIFLIALLLYGLHSLLLHRPLNLKNMRSIGIILLMIGVLILSHFPMHNYIKGFGSSYLSMTMQLYLDIFKNYHEGMIVGGGIIGCCFFYLFYLMFSSVGTVIITFIIIFVGIAFTSRKTVAEFVSFIGKIFFKVFKKTKGVMKTLKYDIDIHPSKTNKWFTGIKSLNIESLKSIPYEDYSIIEEKHAEGVKRTISNVLNNMNIFYNEITYLISYHVTSYIIHTLAFVSLEAMNLKLKKVLSCNFLIKQKIKSNKIVIEVENLQKRQVDLKTIFIKNKKIIDNNEYLMGINSFNEIVKIDFNKNANFFLLGNKALINFIDALIFMILLKKTTSTIKLTILDFSQILPHWKNIINYQQEESFLDEIKTMMDERINKLHQYSLNSQDEYNKSVHGTVPMLQEIIIITGFNTIVDKQLNKETLMYLLQIGKQCGYAFLCTSNDDNEIPSTIISLLENKLIFNSTLTYATKLLGFNGAQLLDEEGEAFYLQRDEVERVSIIQTLKENINFINHKK